MTKPTPEDIVRKLEKLSREFPVGRVYDSKTRKELDARIKEVEQEAKDWVKQQNGPTET